MDGTTACVVLGVEPGATRQQIKRAFRTLAQSAHPDRAGSADEFRTLKEAYDVALSSAPKSPARRATDADLAPSLSDADLAFPRSPEPAASSRLASTDRVSAQTAKPQPVTPAAPTAATVARPTAAPRTNARAWLTNLATDFPATASYNSMVAQASRRATSDNPVSAPTAKAPTDFADFLEDALSGAA